MVDQHHVSSCRLCGGASLRPVILLPCMPFTDEFVTQERLGKEFVADIIIVACEECGAAQNASDTEMGDYYRDYTYTVQSSPFAMRFMQSLAHGVVSRIATRTAPPAVLEIGSGSGEQLMEFQKLGCKVVGVEPSSKLSDFANQHGVYTIQGFFGESVSAEVERQVGQIDAVVTSYTFDHIPHPVEVLKVIHSMLRDEGLLVIEVHDLDLIGKRSEFCLFEHEHYTYLNERTMADVLGRNGFEVETYSLLDDSVKRGNSLLVVARKRTNPRVSAVRVSEELAALRAIQQNVRGAIANVDAWLSVNQDKTIVAYGAGGRGVMTTAALSNCERLSYMVDKNPKAIDVYAPKTHLPVFGIEELGKRRADLVLVFSFGYMEEIVSELQSLYGYEPQQFVSVLELLVGGRT